MCESEQHYSENEGHMFRMIFRMVEKEMLPVIPLPFWQEKETGITRAL